jgi:hypothetical protein
MEHVIYSMTRERIVVPPNIEASNMEHPMPKSAHSCVNEGYEVLPAKVVWTKHTLLTRRHPAGEDVHVDLIREGYGFLVRREELLRSCCLKTSASVTSPVPNRGYHIHETRCIFSVAEDFTKDVLLEGEHFRAGKSLQAIVAVGARDLDRNHRLNA